MNLFLLLCWLTFAATPPTSKVADSEIRFQITNAGLKVDGTLSGLEADIQFDPAHPEQAHLQASVPVSSIQTGISLRDKHLQKPDYFDAAKYPAILMQSKTVRATGAGSYEGTFDLTMKGITQTVKMPFTVSPTRELNGMLQVNRLDFNIGKSSIILSDKVSISIRVKLVSAS